MANVTLRDVARRAGVSYQTVSRVINQHAYVAEETRQRILETIAELDYHPNKAARSLAARRSQTLALITFGLDFYGPAQMMINVERAAKVAGYDLILSNVTGASVKSIQDALNSIRRWQVDGVLMITPIVDMSYENITNINIGVPVVQINGQVGANTPSAIVEQRYGSSLITRHLIELGHIGICEISGPLHWIDAVERHESWMATIRDADLTPGVSIEGDWTAQSGYRAANKLIESQADFTAIVVGNDQMALGAMHALKQHGLRVPEYVSVVGFDDIPEATFFVPPITTIRQDFGALGKCGVEYLIDCIEDPDLPVEQHIIYPEFILRASTAAPRK